MNDKIAIYLRLSLADGDLKKGSKDESNSIENQRMLLHDYIGKQEDLFGEIVEYVDDGYTGTNFNRPAFQKMIVDLKQGNIKVIIVKDLSRLGRDYIGVGDYIEQIFPLMGVRFIAVNNSFDSMKLNNGTPGIEVAVSNLVNNMYSRDIAKKVRAALETNWKNGKATCTNVPFGYVWNKKGGRRWEIDPEAAPCVKKVFELALSGRNTTQIAYGMNELQFPTPGLYAKRKNLLMGSNPIIAPDSEMLWNAAIVWRILRRYEYTGALVMGRRKKIDVNTTSIRTLPEDKWIIAENAHEAIVTKDEYYQAQKAIRNVTPIQYKVGDDFALKGKICCGNCKRQLRHEKQYGEMVFCCGYKRAAGKFSKCYGGYYREYSVNAKVARAIKTVFYALDVVNQGMQEKQSITVRCVDIESLEKQAEAIRVEQIKLYESYADGVLLRDAYIEKKKALSEKLAALQDSIRTEKEEQECADELDEEIRNLTKQASQKTYIGGLTKECVDAFVSMVYLYDDQTIRPCDKNNPNAIRWGRLKEGRWCASTLGCRGLAKTLFDIMEWDEDLRYRFRGQFLEQGDNKMMLFAFDEPEMIKVEEIVLPPKENTEEDEGETVKKKIYIFPPEWAGTFGQPITSIAQVGILRQEHYAGNWDVFRPATEIEEMNIFTAESLNELLREAEKIMEGWTDYR